VTKSELNKHLKVHQGIKDHHCDYEGCGMSFLNKYGLNRHSKTHTDEYHQRQKKEEEKIDKLFCSNELHFIREHQVSFKCIGSTFARVDFLIYTKNHVILLEIDENQHKCGEYSVACDMKRMAKIYESLVLGGNTLPICFLRYNPHAYRVGGKLQAKKTVYRQKALLDMIKSINDRTDKDLSILYMYYDCETLTDGSNSLSVHIDPEYNKQMKECCLPPII
jgi:hypothetical protein